jgi:hypothetical protein
MDKVITKIINDAAIKNGVDYKTAELVYTDMFKFIRATLEAIDFDNISTEDELRIAKTNFNIPRVFKLYTTPSRIGYARESIRKSNSKYDEGVSTDDDAETSGSVKPHLTRPVRAQRYSKSN